MIDLARLRVSLTKNGYFKLAALLGRYSRWEVLDHLRGEHEGIDIIRSQIKNIMDENPTTGEIPEFWDSIRPHGEKATDAFTLVATLYSHETFIRLLQSSSQERPEFTGYFLREDMKTKAYTNIAYAFGCFGVSDYRPGAGAVEYDLAPVVYHLLDAGHLVRELLASKLRRAGWTDPSRNPLSPDDDLLTELRTHQLNRVMSMEWPRFESWLNGKLRLKEPVGRFGLRAVGLFKTPLPPAAGTQTRTRSAPA